MVLVKKYSKTIDDIKAEIGKAVVGQENVVEGLIIALLCDGHALLEGVPGVAIRNDM